MVRALSIAELSPFNAFVMVKKTLSKHQLIKISITYAHKVWSWYKNDTTAMATTTNEAWMGQLDENYFLMGKEWHFG